MRESTKNNYWAAELDDIFMEYAKSSPKKQNALYEEYLKAPLEKLTECVMNTYKFPYIQEQPKDAQHDCLVHLITHANYYDKDKGKSFSYFNLIAKNHYVQLNNRYYEKIKKHVPFNTVAPDKNEEDISPFKIMDDKCFEQHGYQEVKTSAIEFFYEVRKYFKEHFNSIFIKPAHIKIGKAFLKLLDDGFDIEGGKKLMYEKIRDEANVNTQTITRVMCIIRAYYDKMLKCWREHGNLSYVEIPISSEFQYWRNWRNWSKAKETKLRKEGKSGIELERQPSYKGKTQYQSIYQYGKRFVIQIVHNNRSHRYGSFDTIEEAVKKYNFVVVKLKGKNAKLHSL